MFFSERRRVNRVLKACRFYRAQLEAAGKNEEAAKLPLTREEVIIKRVNLTDIQNIVFVIRSMTADDILVGLEIHSYNDAKNKKAAEQEARLAEKDKQKKRDQDARVREHLVDVLTCCVLYPVVPPDDLADNPLIGWQLYNEILSLSFPQKKNR